MRNGDLEELTDRDFWMQHEQFSLYEYKGGVAGMTTSSGIGAPSLVLEDNRKIHSYKFQF